MTSLNKPMISIYSMGSFTSYVDRFLGFFDPSLPPRRQFIYWSLFTRVDIWKTPPSLSPVYVDCEWPLNHTCKVFFMKFHNLFFSNITKVELLLLRLVGCWENLVHISPFLFWLFLEWSRSNHGFRGIIIKGKGACKVAWWRLWIFNVWQVEFIRFLHPN